ncbi:MAG: hypothetical protein VX672_08085 [Planctomycetota bacterium]|nr:hypothetical protein [Planctomycetota bacterium]
MPIQPPTTRPPDLRIPTGWALITALLLLGAGCASEPPRPPAAASNEVFDDRIGGRSPVIDDRWASITLDENQRIEVRRTLREGAHGPISPLIPATHGMRFEDVPRAIINAAPKVEMAILRQAFVPAEVAAEYRDRQGRRATARILLRSRGPVAAVSYRISGDEIARSRSRQLIDLNERLAFAARPDRSLGPESATAILRASLRSQGAGVEQVTFIPDRYRFTLLMLDEQEAELEVRREPPPRQLSWTASAGLFGDPERSAALGRELEETLRAWGRVPEVDDSTSR